MWTRKFATNESASAVRAKISIASCAAFSTSRRTTSPSAGGPFGREALIKQADEAMYAAKRAGGNAVRFFTPSPVQASG
ncbi:MAG TPA: GGDEF domain-containing protein [Candidatus Baltobacteraceae bacterium]